MTNPAQSRLQATNTYKQKTGVAPVRRKRPDWAEVHKQDFIMRNFDMFATKLYDEFVLPGQGGSGPSAYTNLNYEHITSLKDPPEDDVMQGIFPFLGTTGFDAYVEMPNKVFSSLVPFARVSKVVQNNLKNQTVQMQMASHLGIELNQFGTTVESMMTNRASRGYGGGIQQLDIEMSGSNIASAKRMYDIKIQYFFSSMAEMFEERTDSSSGVKYRFADLISKSAHPYENESSRCGGLKNGKPSFSPEAGTKLMLEFGYADLDANITPYEDSPQKSKAARELIKDTVRVVFLNLFKHKVDLKENGTLIVTAEYHGYVEEAKNRIDILSLMASGGGAQTKLIRELEYDLCRYRSSSKPKTAGAAASGKETEYDERKRREIEKKEEKLKRLRSEAYSYILDKLYWKNQIFAATLETNNVEPYTLKFKKKPPMLNTDMSSLDDLKKTAKEDRLRGGGGIDRSGSTWSRISTLGGLTGSTTEGIIRWVYLGPILEVIYELVHDVDPDIRLLVGSILHYPTNPKKSKQSLHVYPLARFPIALTAFAEWWHHHVLQRGERQRYFLMDFIRDITTGLVAGCYDIASFGETDANTLPVLPATTFAINSFQSPKRVPTGRHDYVTAAKRAECVTSGYVGSNDSKSRSSTQSTRNSSGNKARKKVNENANLLLYANQPPFFEGEKISTKTSDAARGIWHLRGSNLKGVVRSLKFSHADAKFGTEARMINNGMSSIEASMWGFYNANVELFGCTSFYPGAMVRITSAEFDPKEADKIGLGGYYRILKVKHKIRQGSFITELECQWEAKASL